MAGQVVIPPVKHGGSDRIQAKTHMCKPPKEKICTVSQKKLEGKMEQDGEKAVPKALPMSLRTLP